MKTPIRTGRLLDVGLWLAPPVGLFLAATLFARQWNHSTVDDAILPSPAIVAERTEVNRGDVSAGASTETTVPIVTVHRGTNAAVPGDTDRAARNSSSAGLGDPGAGPQAVRSAPSIPADDPPQSPPAATVSSALDPNASALPLVTPLGEGETVAPSDLQLRPGPVAPVSR